MTNLSTKIKLYANREIDFLKDVRLQDNSDGKGVFIAEWNLDIPKPTLAQLDAFEAQATTCLLYTSPSPRDRTRSRMPSSA